PWPCLRFASCSSRICFSFTAPATSSPYPLSLHDALPICFLDGEVIRHDFLADALLFQRTTGHGSGRDLGQLQTSCLGNIGNGTRDRKSTRLNSSHVKISYAVFCLKKKK